ncbi:MAG: hypothetical protein WDO56_05165 [Gammaproteobacteria bacterium]
MPNLLHKKERRPRTSVSMAHRKRAKRRGLCSHAVETRLVRNTLKRPRNLIVPSPCKVLTEFCVQVRHFR